MNQNKYCDCIDGESDFSNTNMEYIYNGVYETKNSFTESDNVRENSGLKLRDTLEYMIMLEKTKYQKRKILWVI